MTDSNVQSNEGSAAPVVASQAADVPPAPAEPVAAPAATTIVRYASPSPLRVAIVVTGVVAILAGAAITFAANNRNTGATTAGDSASLLNGDGEIFEFGGRGPDGPGFGLHGRFHQITITAINGNNLSLKTADGWTRTITVDSGTTYEKAGATIALGDLAVGDQIGFRQTLEDDGSYTIDAVVVVLPHVGGKVTAIDGSTITVERRDGTSATVKVTSDTSYRVGDDTSAALSDISVGDFVVAEGTENSDGSLTASRVLSLPDGPHFRHRFGPGLPHDGSKPNTDSNSNTSTEG
jgi:hypothetical protein